MKLKDKIAVISGAVIPMDGGLSAAMESPNENESWMRENSVRGENSVAQEKSCCMPTSTASVEEIRRFL